VGERRKSDVVEIRGVVVWQRNGRRPAWWVDYLNGSLRAEPVKIANGGRQFVALLPFEKQLSDFFASALIVDSWELFFLFLVLVLVVHRSETVVRVPGLVLRLGVLRFDFPYTLLF
jgi:hypothetical protein